MNVGYAQKLGSALVVGDYEPRVRRTSYRGESVGPRCCGGPRVRRAPNWTSFCRRAWTPPKRRRASVGADRCNVVRRRRRVRPCSWPHPAWLWRRRHRRRCRRGLVEEAAPRARHAWRARRLGPASCGGGRRRRRRAWLALRGRERSLQSFASRSCCGTTGLRTGLSELVRSRRSAVARPNQRVARLAFALYHRHHFLDEYAYRYLMVPQTLPRHRRISTQSDADKKYEISAIVDAPCPQPTRLRAPRRLLLLRISRLAAVATVRMPRWLLR
jgi:hypothetical protein